MHSFIDSEKRVSRHTHIPPHPHGHIFQVSWQWDTLCTFARQVLFDFIMAGGLSLSLQAQVRAEDFGVVSVVASV